MQATVTEETTVVATEERRWRKLRLLDYGGISNMVEYVNQTPDYADSLSGDWYYGHADSLTIYGGSFSNSHSPGASHYTTATLYPDQESFVAALAEWEARPEYLSDDDLEDDDDAESD